MINKLMKMLDIPFNEEEYEKNIIKKSDAIRDCLCRNTAISGAFNELNDKDKQNVVNTFNAVQGMFDGLFGVKTRPYTAEDFKDAKVSVHTSTTGEPKPENPCEECDKTCECESCDTKKKYNTMDAMKDTVRDHATRIVDGAKKVYETCKKNILEHDETGEEQSICDSLLDELQDNTDFETAAKDIAQHVVSVIRNKQDKKYTLTPETPIYPPQLKMNVYPIDIEWTNDRARRIAIDENLWNSGSLRQIVKDEIKRVTKAPEVYLDYFPSGILSVIIVLKLKKTE